MRVERTAIDQYKTFLAEPGRPPSRGGNTRAWHSHVLFVDGERYSFLALGARKWIYASDVASFDWNWDEEKRYRNIDRDSIRVWDKDGNVVVRGERAVKPWRTASSRLPVSRREMRD
jgi:hypothetical protein